MAVAEPGNQSVMAVFTITLLLLFIGGCSDSGDFHPPVIPETPEEVVLMNQLQYLGTHNSYHIRPKADIFELLLAAIADLALTLEYTHVPLQQQFESQGIRQIELDIFHDPNGGLYADHQARTLFGEEAASGIPELDEPGLKVLHVQEVDYETTCYTFVICLQEIKIWSDSNRRHLPITVLVEAKDEVIDDPLKLNFVIPVEFDRVALDLIDTEVPSVFPESQLIMPDDIRGTFSTLEGAV